MPLSKHDAPVLPRPNAPLHTPSIDSMMREVLHRLGDLDADCEIRLDQIERSATDREVKAFIKGTIRAAYRERRAPYMEILATLRQRQQRLSSQASPRSTVLRPRPDGPDDDEAGGDPIPARPC